MFIAKYDPNGSVLWAKRAGRASDDYGRAVITDDQNNVYVAGSFKSSAIIFGSNILTNSDPSEFTYDIFITKYDSVGNILWSKQEGGLNDEYLRAIAIDTSGNLLAAGHFNSASLSVGPTTLSSSGLFDIFFVKYDQTGSLLWANKGGGTTTDYCHSIATDRNGNIFIGGGFGSPVLSLDSISLTTATASMYIAKYNSSGNILWAKNANGSGSNVQDIATDTSGNVFVTGFFSGPTFSLDTLILNNQGDYDVFIAAYDSVGSLTWAKGAGNTLEEEAFSIAVCGPEIYIAGRFQSTTIEFPPFELYNAGADDAFLAKIDRNKIIGIKEINNKNEFSVFPNPFSLQTNIVFPENVKNVKISIFNLMGQEVKSIYFTGNHIILDRVELNEGIYFIRIVNENNEISNKKIVIQ
jgi:hypothetical protein